MKFDRRPLPEQVSEMLLKEIDRGRWKSWLPPERALAKSLDVSRNTIRTALQHLQANGCIESVRSRGYRLTGGANLRNGHDSALPMVVLSPLPYADLLPSTCLLLDEFRALLFRKSIDLEVYNVRNLFQVGSPRLLSQFIGSHPASCWILVQAPRPVQVWFSEMHLPCLLSGSAFSDATIPSVDVDYRAIGAHAAGRLLGKGHRDMLILIGEKTAGEHACEQGFRLIAGKFNASVSVLHQSSNIEETRRALVNMLKARSAITAIFAADSYLYLTIFSVLSQLGLRVPQDISLICAGSDSFLPFMIPEPSHYALDQALFARKLYSRVMKIIEGNSHVPRKTRLMPRFVKGGSLDVPRREAALDHI